MICRKAISFSSLCTKPSISYCTLSLRMSSISVPFGEVIYMDSCPVVGSRMPEPGCNISLSTARDGVNRLFDLLIQQIEVLQMSVEQVGNL